MRALVVKELPGIELHSIIEVEVINGLLTSKDLKSCIKLEDVILEGARWEVVKAAEEGREIEVWCYHESKWEKKANNGEWISTSFYRIAPEPPKPQYVPFTAKDWEMFVGKGIKVPGTRMAIVLQWDKGDVLIATDWYSYENAFKKCTFLDGSPFGKKIVS